MKILKVSIITIVLLATALCLPISAKASSDMHNIILNERQLYFNSMENSNDFFSTRAMAQTVINRNINRSVTIPITRSSLNNGINIEITPVGHYLLVALFKRGSTTEVIGTSFTAPADRMTAWQWSAAELGNNTQIDVFISATANVNVYAYGAITY